MKKSIFLISTILFLISCESPKESKPVEAIYGPVGVDSSVILPPLTDSAKIDTIGGNAALSVE